MGGYSDKADILKVVIDAGTDINVKFQGMTLLHVAAMYGDPSGAKTELLIAKDLDVNAKIIGRNLEGTTPLHLAAGKGNIKVPEVLIKNGAEVDAKDSKQYKTPLQVAAQNGNKAAAELLIAKGADVNAKEGYYGETPLYLAISKGHKELADLLRKHGGVIRKK